MGVQIAAEVLRVPLSSVSVVRSKTGLTPFERSTGASRSTTLQGRAIVDIFRLEDGKVVEHWDVIQDVAEPAQAKNAHGMF